MSESLKLHISGSSHNNLSIFYLSIITNYIRDKTSYLNLMSVNKKCGKLNDYINQFDAYPPFNDDKLFKLKSSNNIKHDTIYVYTNNTISTEFDSKLEIDTLYLRRIPTKFENKINVKNLVLSKCLYDEDSSLKKSELKKFNPENIIIPNSITKINDYAFCDCTRLKSITIPNSIKEIGEGAFCNCLELSYLNIPNSVTKISKYAFCDCTSLSSIILPDSVEKISKYAFVDVIV